MNHVVEITRITNYPNIFRNYGGDNQRILSAVEDKGQHNIVENNFYSDNDIPEDGDLPTRIYNTTCRESLLYELERLERNNVYLISVTMVVADTTINKIKKVDNVSNLIKRVTLLDAVKVYQEENRVTINTIMTKNNATSFGKRLSLAIFLLRGESHIEKFIVGKLHTLTDRYHVQELINHILDYGISHKDYSQYCLLLSSYIITINKSFQRDFVGNGPVSSMAYSNMMPLYYLYIYYTKKVQKLYVGYKEIFGDYAETYNSNLFALGFVMNSSEMSREIMAKIMNGMGTCPKDLSVESVEEVEADF